VLSFERDGDADSERGFMTHVSSLLNIA
jgi:hypothetical protein